MAAGRSPVLRGARVVLRPPCAADVGARLRLGRHPEIVRCYGGDARTAGPMSAAEAGEEIRRIGEQPHAWVIDAGGFIGQVRLHSVVVADRRASLAIGIDDPAKLGQGYGTQALRLVLAHAFEGGLHRVGLRVLADNTRAIAAYRKCGFVGEGRERETALVDGVWRDDLLMGLLDHEFLRSGPSPARPWRAPDPTPHP